MKRLSCVRRAIHYCFTSYARMKSGSAREGLFRALPAHSPVWGSPVLAGTRNGVRISRRSGRAAGAEARPDRGGVMPQLRRIPISDDAGRNSDFPPLFYPFYFIFLACISRGRVC
jgi:hypothetical protein